MKIAVVHRFIYQKGGGYPGAPKEQEVSGYRKALQGYDVAVFGDNHVGFKARAGDCLVWNCGSMMRRTIDQRDYESMVGMLHSDGTVKPHFLDCSEDKWIDGNPDEPLTRRDFTRFMEELSDLGGGDLDFRKVIGRYLEKEKIGGGTRWMVLEAMEQGF